MAEEEVSDHESAAGENVSDEEAEDLYQADSLQLSSFTFSESLEIPENVEFDRNVSYSFKTFLNISLNILVGQHVYSRLHQYYR